MDVPELLRFSPLLLITARDELLLFFNDVVLVVPLLVPTLLVVT